MGAWLGAGTGGRGALHVCRVLQLPHCTRRQIRGGARAVWGEDGGAACYQRTAGAGRGGRKGAVTMTSVCRRRWQRVFCAAHVDVLSQGSPAVQQSTDLSQRGREREGPGSAEE